MTNEAPITQVLLDTAFSAKSIIIAGIGGAMQYIYSVYKGHKFEFWRFSTRVILAGFIGYIAGELIPLDTSGRDAILAILGVSSLPIMDIIHEKGQDIFKRFIS